MTKKEVKKQKKAELKQKLSAMTTKQRSKYYMKKALVVILVIFVVLACLYFALDFINTKLEESGSSVTGISQADEEYLTYSPFAAEWNKNVFEDGEYMSLNRTIMYGDIYTGTLYEVEKGSASEHEGHRFFEKYFSMLQNGDYETYPSFFEEEYNADKNFEKNTSRKFPPQMVYDITIKEAGRFDGVYKNKDVLRGVYIVDYKIFRNNNLFRSDIGYSIELEADSSRPLVFELITYGAGTKDEKTYIHAMYTESSILAKPEK